MNSKSIFPFLLLICLLCNHWTALQYSFFFLYFRYILKEIYETLGTIQHNGKQRSERMKKKTRIQHKVEIKIINNIWKKQSKTYQKRKEEKTNIKEMLCCWCITSCLALCAVSTGYSIFKGLASLKGTPEE